MILKLTTYRISKQKLLRKLVPMRKEEFGQLINPLIAKSRSLPLEEAKHKQFLQSNEVVAFLEKIGEPLEDHGKMIVVSTHQMDKKKLRTQFPTISQLEFSKLLNRIIFMNRELNYRDSSRRRYLRPKEVVAFLGDIGEIIPEPKTGGTGEEGKDS